MKTINIINLRLIFLALLAIGFYSCKQSVEPEPTLEEQRTATLNLLVAGTSPWEASSILRDDQANDDNLPGFTLKFADGTFTTQNGKHVWPESGTWSFTDGRADQIIRDDGLVIDLEVKEKELILKFELDENVYSVGGRPQTVLARYIFNLFRL